MPLNTIQNIIKECRKCTTTNPPIILVETKNRDKPHSLEKVTIRNAHNSVWFSVDHGKNWSPFLTNDRGIQKRCDYVLFTPVKQSLYILFIELKSKNLLKPEISEKFKATECFIDYCDSIAKRFFDCSILKGCLKRFVVFYLAPSINKTPTRPIKSNHSKPENPLYFANPDKPKLSQLL